MSICINQPHKIPLKYENPVDKIFMSYATQNMHMYHDIGFTPNGITTLSILFSLLSVHFLVNKQYELSALCFLINYYYDCMDGAMARCYDEVTKFGDYYDHISDIINIIIFILITTCYYNKKCSSSDAVYVFMTMITLSVLILVHVGFQEIYYDKEKNSGDFFSDLLRSYGIDTKEDAEKYMPYTRYFGCGTYNLALAGFIFMLRYCKNQ